jgi:hypothetical protein
VAEFICSSLAEVFPIEDAVNTGRISLVVIGVIDTAKVPIRSHDRVFLRFPEAKGWEDCARSSQIDRSFIVFVPYSVFGLDAYSIHSGCLCYEA